MYVCDIMDADLNLIHSLKRDEFRIMEVTQEMNAKGQCTIDVNTFKSHPNRADFELATLFQKRDPELLLWKRARVYYSPTPQFRKIIFDGWIYDIMPGYQATTFTITNAKNWLLRKPAKKAYGAGDLESVMNLFWADINSYRATGVSLNILDMTSGAYVPLPTDTTYFGTYFGELIDRAVELGHEVRWENGVLTFDKIIANYIGKGLVFKSTSSRLATIEPPQDKHYDGAKLANYVNSRREQGGVYNTGEYQATIPSDSDWIGLHKPFNGATNLNEKCQEYTEKYDEGDIETDIVLRPEHFKPGDILAGDIVRVRIDTGFKILDMDTEIRVRKVRTSFTDTSYSIVVTVATDPEAKDQMEELRRRVKILETGV